MVKILVVDDDLALLDTLGEVLRRNDYDVQLASRGSEAEELVRRHDYDLLLLDYKMPETTGIDLMVRLRRIRPTAEAVILTAYGTIDRGIEAVRKGARDFLTKPIERQELLHRLDAVLDYKRMQDRLRQKDRELKQQYDLQQILGVSKAISDIRKFSEDASCVLSTVLIEGESGTGKELVARAIHYSSERATGPFLALNCGAITETLAERELFGNEKGAYTGATERKTGYFEAAANGTLLLDEIGDMPLSLQVKLLRTLDQQAITRVGGTSPIPITSRIIFATHRNLEEMVEAGTFRHDLFYRINVLRVTIPPLRERREDIPLLATSFSRRAAERIGASPKPFADDALIALEEYDWPGNARELQNVVERVVALSRGEKIELVDLPAHILQANITEEAWNAKTDFMAARRQAQEEFDRTFILRSLLRNSNNVSQTAREIGLARTALQRYMRKYNIQREELEPINTMGVENNLEA